MVDAAAALEEALVVDATALVGEGDAGADGGHGVGWFWVWVEAGSLGAMLVEVFVLMCVLVVGREEGGRPYLNECSCLDRRVCLFGEEKRSLDFGGWTGLVFVGLCVAWT